MADTTNETVSVREAAFRLFRAHGLTTIFGNPGSTELPMFRDFPADFRYVLGLQESIVIAMADGFAQATNNAALVNLHSAAGVGHSLGNLFTAYKNQTPLVVTAGQQARAVLPYEPFLFARDAIEFPKPYVKWACEPARAEDVPAALARAYHIAMQVPRGPTFVSVPVDDWDRPCMPVVPRAVSQSRGPDPAMLEVLAAALGGAERPALVLGAPVARDGAWGEAVELAERHRAAVWVAPMSARNAFPEDHRLFQGFLPADRAGIVKRLAPYDVVLLLGAPAFTYHTEGAGPFVPATTKILQLTDDPEMAAWGFAETSVVSGMKLGLQALLAAPAPRERQAPPPLARPEPLDGQLLSDGYLVQQIARLKPRGSVLVEEAPSTRGPMHDRLPITEENGFYTCASGGLGHGLPAAVGVALGRPGTRVVSLLGDGSAMYAIQGLWSAAQHKLPIAFIVVNNGAYKALDTFAPEFGLKQAVGTKLPALDFVGLAESQGVRGVRVREAHKLDAALADAFAADGPSLIEVVVA